MLNQTTCVSFKDYGINISNLPIDILISKNKNSINPMCNSVDRLYLCESDIYISKTGSVLLLVSLDGSFDNINSYIINDKVKLNKGVYYNFIPVSQGCQVSIYGENTFNSFLHLSKPYEYCEITPNIDIDKIYIRLYQEKGINYVFSGEKHYFWELTFVDRGVLHTNVDGVDFKLNQGDFMFYSPYQFHKQHTDDKKACSYLTVCFSLDFEHSPLLSNKVFTCDKELLYIISKLIKELNGNSLYGSQLSICYLKELILKAISSDSCSTVIKPTTRVQQHFDDNILNEILEFINDNIYEYIDINQICMHFGISNSKLKILFKSNLDTTVKSYINELKLTKSKDLIRESNYTISEISNLLGFASIHYFSKRFKLFYGFSPREYLKSTNTCK